jgi:hypothetical protein
MFAAMPPLHDIALPDDLTAWCPMVVEIPSSRRPMPTTAHDVIQRARDGNREHVGWKK